MTPAERRYARQTSLAVMGDNGQQRLADAHVLVMGAGGLGTPAALYLASSGIGRITICDFDTVDETNLPRQILYREADSGLSKATIAAKRLGEFNPELNCEVLDKRLTEEELAHRVELATLVLDCTDNFASRWTINQVCALQSTPLVSGAAIRLEGQLAVFRHDVAGGPCFRCLYDEADENLNDCAGQGILAPVAGTIGTMMATEAIKLILNIESDLCGQLWTYDATSGRSHLLKIPVRDDCPICAN